MLLYETWFEKSSFSKIIFKDGIEPIEIIGLDSKLKGNINYELETTDYYKILLIHEPSLIESLNNKYNLILAGHTHGGQINIPLIKNIFIPKDSINYTKDHYDNMYINYGLGTKKAHLRFLNHPSINLYRLYNN